MKSQPFKIDRKIIFLWILTGVITLLSVLFFINYFKNGQAGQKSEDLSAYYPKTSFKIPNDLRQEMIASKSASSVKLPIIMYHYVEYADPKDPGRVKLSVPPSLLESQLKAIKSAGFQPVFVRDVPSIVAHTTSVVNPVVLTFDDGYEDFYYWAFPILKRYQMRSTIYVIYNFIGRKGYLNESQIKEIINSGLVELASHTLDHAYLKGLKDDVAWKQIYDSKLLLEKRFGVPVPSFAYPYGAFTKETVDLVKKAGYTNAVSVIPGIMQSDTNDLFLFRIRPGYINTSNFVKSLDSFNK